MSRQSPDCEPGPYEQILLFGDSITQGAARNRWAKQGDSLGEMSATGDDKNYGFCFTAALQNGERSYPVTQTTILTLVSRFRALIASRCNGERKLTISFRSLHS